MYQNIDYEYYGLLQKGSGANEDLLENIEEYELFERKKMVDDWIMDHKMELIEKIPEFAQMDERAIYQRLSSKEYYKPF
jgi:hypothetical protein